MWRKTVTHSLFPRIGNSYGHFIDPDHFLGRNAFDDLWLTRPGTNIKDEGNQYHLQIALPGFSKEDISLHAVERMVRVTARNHKNDDYKDRYLEQELSLDKLRRSFKMPSDADMKNVTTHFCDGMLDIHIGKK